MGIKFLGALAIVIVLLAITAPGFNQMYNADAPSEADINRVMTMPNGPEGRQAAQDLLKRSEQANNTRNMFFIVMGVEVIGGLVALKKAWQ
jgi:hypothetical protein